ncbi:hypothetical protein U9M48_037536 [Paspalum notatum var. saurae]|uniref:Uncharacterized protein n=1 Tax=Paspalum notatum var. saurae TaxID=547442 RepID=A0AAQ3XA42_PASNO
MPPVGARILPRPQLTASPLLPSLSQFRLLSHAARRLRTVRACSSGHGPAAGCLLAHASDEVARGSIERSARGTSVARVQGAASGTQGDNGEHGDGGGDDSDHGSAQAYGARSSRLWPTQLLGRSGRGARRQLMPHARFGHLRPVTRRGQRRRMVACSCPSRAAQAQAIFRGAYYLRFWALLQREDARENNRSTSKATEIS